MKRTTIGPYTVKVHHHRRKIFQTTVQNVDVISHRPGDFLHCTGVNKSGIALNMLIKVNHVDINITTNHRIIRAALIYRVPILIFTNRLNFFNFIGSIVMQHWETAVRTTVCIARHSVSLKNRNTQFCKIGIKPTPSAGRFLDFIDNKVQIIFWTCWINFLGQYRPIM